jgi:hypothetical protein
MQLRATLQQRVQQHEADDDRRREREELRDRQRLNEAMRQAGTRALVDHEQLQGH